MVSIISLCLQDVEPVLTRNMTIVPFWKLAASNAVRPIDTRGPVEAPKRPDSNKGWTANLYPLSHVIMPKIANSTEYNKNVENCFTFFQLQKRRRNNRNNSKLLLSKAPLSVYICQPWMELPPGHVNVCGPKQYKCKSFKKLQQFRRRHLQYPAVISQPSTVNCHIRPGSSLQNPGKNAQLHIAQL